MTDPLSALRATVSAMTPGPYHYDDNSGAVCHTQPPEYSPCVASYVNEDNGIGFVSAVAIARFVADPESVEKVAMTLRYASHPPQANPSGNLVLSMADIEEMNRRYHEETALACLTLIARAANHE